MFIVRVRHKLVYSEINSLRETIARQTIELTFEPFFHWTKNFKTSKISKFQNFQNISKFLKYSKNFKILNSHFLKIFNFNFCLF
jgi:hypothetical protein